MKRKLDHYFSFSMLCLRQLFSLESNLVAVYRLASKKSIKARIDYSSVPKLDENDLDENFAHGSGPGGQKVNKAHNCVTLVHKPTGIVVKNHEFRELKLNRARAREIMLTKLDNFLNGERSVEAQWKRIEAEIKMQKEIEASKRRELRKKVKQLWEKGNGQADVETGQDREQIEPIK